MTQAAPLVIVGSGTAGYTLARQVRAHDTTRPIVIVTADGGEVYSKPLLSNALAKGQTPASLVQKTAEAKGRELNCEVRAHCTVEHIDRAHHVLATSRGEVAYAQLVLALGAGQRVFLPAGAQRDWLRTVNSLADFAGWYAELEQATRVLLIGAGLIGCEFADDLMSRGISVELVDPAPFPIARLLPEAMGTALGAALTERGARLHLGRKVARLERDAGHRFLATLDDGTVVTAERVLSATGLVPETGLARAAGLACATGILVDRTLRTSDPDIYALGDCAETPAGFLPYILPIMTEARVLAEVLCGRPGQLVMKAMPVNVKTTSLPLVVCPPRADAVGAWDITGVGRDLTAIFRGPDALPLGFALSGSATREQANLAAQMPGLLPA